MRIDLYALDDGVIETTCNIPDAIWTTPVQIAMNKAAAARGMGIDTSPNNDTIDPNVQTITTSQGLLAWVNANALTSARGSGPPPVTAPTTSGTTGVQVVGAVVGATIAGGALWLAFRTIYPAWPR
jgi:hypothetical protein